jgi:hypothetical protein
MTIWITHEREVLSVQMLGFLISMVFLSGSGLQSSKASAAPMCQHEIRVFLAHPSESSFIALSRRRGGACWQTIASSNSDFDQLGRRASLGSRWAAQYLATHLNQLDGGNLEDALIAVGQFGDHDMERLLSFAKEGVLSKHEFIDTLTMLPLSLSDNLGAQLRYLTARKTKVMHVTRRDLTEQKAWALTSIKDFESEIKSKM